MNTGTGGILDLRSMDLRLHVNGKSQDPDKFNPIDPDSNQDSEAAVQSKNGSFINQGSGTTGFFSEAPALAWQRDVEHQTMFVEEKKAIVLKRFDSKPSLRATRQPDRRSIDGMRRTCEFESSHKINMVRWYIRW